MARTDAAKVLLHARDPDKVLEACASFANKELAELDHIVAAALAGKPSAIHGYVETSRRLIHLLLAGVHEEQPDVVIATATGLAATDVEQRPVNFLEAYLELGALEAPFSPWVSRYGPGKGSALFLVSRFRTAVPGAGPLLVSKREALLPHWQAVGPEEFARFVRRVSELLTVWSDSVPQLEQVKHLFGLSNSELGRLFGASRQAATTWLAKGVPPARLPKLNTVARIGDLLQRKLKPGRVPAVVRNRAPAYDGRTMLDVIADDDHDMLLDDVRATFDWAATA
ncbi:MAG: hypothetical protein QNK03_24305 [Myxococcota bacterium]|nr:hypothetical protein [Myxococcota bacterium]